MGARGRKTAGTNVVSLDRVFHRPDPPDELSEDESGVWRSIVSRMPPGWFTVENYPLLAQYCRHVVQSKIVAEMVHDHRRQDISGYEKLLRMQREESKAIAMLATKMKIAQTSTINASGHRKAGASQAKKPWE